MNEKTTVMVVEDNDFVRMQIVRFLQEAEYDVVESTDGQDALEKITGSIDLAVVDVRMEPIDGFEFIKAIRGQDISTPVILVTGDQNPELLHDASMLGVAAVLMKPVERDRLVKAVEKTVQTIARAS